jgi:hypothetical protein
MLQESRCDLERMNQDLERTRQELEQLKLGSPTFIPAPVSINTSSWQRQSDMLWDDAGSVQSLSPLAHNFNLQG